MAEQKNQYIPFIGNRILLAKSKDFFVPKEKKDPNKFKVETDPKDMFKVKMTPEELADSFKANRGTGVHKNPAEKRKNNPSKNNDGW